MLNKFIVYIGKYWPAYFPVVFVFCIVAMLVVACYAASLDPKVQAQEPRNTIAVDIANSRVDMAVADLDYAKTDLEYWTSEKSRIKDLHTIGTVSDTEYKQVKRFYDRAKIDLIRAEKRLVEMRKLKEYADITGQVDLSASSRPVP